MEGLESREQRAEGKIKSSRDCALELQNILKLLAVNECPNAGQQNGSNGGFDRIAN